MTHRPAAIRRMVSYIIYRRRRFMSGIHLFHKHEDDNYVVKGSKTSRVGAPQYFIQWCYGVVEPVLTRFFDFLLRHESTRSLIGKSKESKILPKCIVLSTAAVCKYIDYIYKIEGPRGARMGIGDCVCQLSLGRERQPKRKDMVLLYTADIYNNIVKTYEPIEDAEEAKAYIHDFHKAGLVHTALYCFNSGQWVFVLCNCDDEICVPLRAHLAGKPTMLPGPEIIELDEAKCVGPEKCGKCLERCILKASYVSGDKTGVDYHKCLGCGLCTSTCRGEARKLKIRAEYKFDDIIAKKILLGDTPD